MIRISAIISLEVLRNMEKKPCKGKPTGIDLDMNQDMALQTSLHVYHLEPPVSFEIENSTTHEVPSISLY